MTVKKLIEECNIDMWQRIVIRRGNETLGGGFRSKILKRYGHLEVDTIWCVEGCLKIKVR